MLFVDLLQSGNTSLEDKCGQGVDAGAEISVPGMLGCSSLFG